MPKLIACIIAYNEEDLLPGCIESVRAKVDEVIVVEGRIHAYPGDSPTSTDKTLQVARDFECTVITSDTPYVDEADMRSQYLIGQQNDVYFHIDADERCMTPLPQPFQGDLPGDVYSVFIKMIGDATGVWRPRFFRHRGVMQYRGVHDALYSDGVLISNPRYTPMLASVWLAHYQMMRTTQRRLDKQQYYKYGYAHEPAIRAELGLYNVKKH